MITIRCLVEDTEQPASPFRAEHGMAWHIDTPHGQLLFDTGQSGEVLLHNAALLGVDLAQIDALALSHAHYDHTGGLRAVLAQAQHKLPVYANPDLFRPRYKTAEDGASLVGIDFAREELSAQVDLHLSAEPVNILPGVWTTGVISTRDTFVGGSTELIVEDGAGGWMPDPYEDDMSIVLETGVGLVLLLGCGHAGILNILRRVRQYFDGPIHTIAGGTHLISATDAHLAEAVGTLQDEYATPQMYPCHCTGNRAFDALHTAFGERVQACPAGTILTFPSV